jgi:hypothetical protein
LSVTEFLENKFAVPAVTQNRSEFSHLSGNENALLMLAYHRHTKLWSENLKERDGLVDLGVDGKIKLE